MFHGVYISPRWNQRRLSLAHLGCDVISRRGCTGVEFYAKRSRKSFHPRSIESLPKVDPLSCRLSDPAFRKRAYTVTETLYTWNIAFNTTKFEIISLSDSKCLEIKDSILVDTPIEFGRHLRVDSVTQFLIKWIITFVFLLLHFSSP